MKKTYGDDLLGDESRHFEKIAIARDTEQKCNRVESVAQDGLQGQFGIVDVEVVSPPSEKTVDQRDSSNDTEQRGDNGSTNLETEPGSVGKGVQGILSLVLVIVGDDNPSSGEGLLSLGISHLGDGQRGGDGHDTG